MNTRSGFLILLIALFPSLALGWWPPSEAIRELGLPVTTDGRLEIRVWFGAGVMRPYDLYRVRDLPDGVTGEWIVWSEVTQPEEDLATPREARHENSSMRKLLRKEYCASEILETDAFMWCTAKLSSNPKWFIIFKDLMPDRLWELPAEVERECGWAQFDGETITIELVQGERHHMVTYSNPEFCCPDVACAMVNHVRSVLKYNVK